MIAYEQQPSLNRRPRFFQRIALPMIGGPLSGMRWSPLASGNPMRLIGICEQDVCNAMEKTLRAGSVVLDIGARWGFHTMLFARRVGSSGRVISVESDPGRASVVRHHCSVNRLENVDVVDYRLGGASEVQHRDADLTLDDLVSVFALAPTHVRMAIANHELSILEAGWRIIARYRPMMFIATRDSVRHRCCKLLAQLGYELRPLVGSNVANAEQLICTPPSIGSHRAA